jgi:perosamine synthetase
MSESDITDHSAVDVPKLVAAVRAATQTPKGSILLHQPNFEGNEWTYVKQCIDTGWVSSAGSFVTDFERLLQKFTSAKHAVAAVNGTAALHIALMLCGVGPGTEVLMPSLTFIATANAASYCGATPHFCDVTPKTLGIDVDRLAEHLKELAEPRPEGCFNRKTGRRIAAIVPMHTFGHCMDLAPLCELAGQYAIPVVEDAAESLGSFYRGRHTGTFGRVGVLSFNGNKIVTTGAGGAILTDDAELAKHARHITTTAKVPHAWEYVHDEVGYNYRMPNLNAAMGCGQMERLEEMLRRKRELAGRYLRAFAGVAGVKVFTEPADSRSNYWLNTLILDKPDMGLRDAVLKALNDAGLQSRPIWRPMHQLTIYQNCPRMDLRVTEDLASRVVNVPSSAGLVAEGPS